MMHDNDEAYKRLAESIVIRAARDFRKYAKRLKKEPVDLESFLIVVDCIDFFRSDRFSTICDIDPEELMRRLLEG